MLDRQTKKRENTSMAFTVLIATGWRYFVHQINLPGVFRSCDVFMRVLKGQPSESTFNPRSFDDLLTWHNPFPDQLRHVQIKILFSVSNYRLGKSREHFKFSVKALEYLVDQALWILNFVVFDATRLAVISKKQLAIFKSDTIFICFIVLVISVCC